MADYESYHSLVDRKMYALSIAHPKNEVVNHLYNWLKKQGIEKDSDIAIYLKAKLLDFYTVR